MQMDLDALEEQLAGMENCRLVIIDPIDAHLTGGNTVAARMWLRSLAKIAAKYQVAMVLVTGLKDGRKSPLYRLMGGKGLAGAARGELAVVKDARREVGGQRSEVKNQESGDRSQESEGERKLLLGGKNNLSGERTGMAFGLLVEEGRGVPRVEWSSEVVTETVEDVMEALRQIAAKPSYAVNRAMEFLQEALAAGPRLTREVEMEAKQEHGISKASLERARKEMKVRAFRKEIPGASWICSKDDEAWKTEPMRVVEGVEGVESVASTSSTQVGKGAGERNVENAEDAEKVEGVEGVEGVDFDGFDKLSVDKLSPGQAGDDEILNEKTLAAMEAFLRSPSSFGDLSEEQQALLRDLIKDEERHCTYWMTARERLEDVEGVEGLGFDGFDRFGKLTTGKLTADKLIPGENGAATRIALREQRRKLAAKKRRMRKERQRQNKMQRSR